MAQSATVLLKTQEALALYLQGQVTVTTITQNIYKGKSVATKDLPDVICKVTKGREEPADTGNYWVEVEIEIRTSAGTEAGAGDGEVDTEDASSALETAVMNAMEVDDLAAQLTAAAADFTCMGVGDGKEVEHEQDPDGDAMAARLKLMLYCAPSDL